MKQFSEKEMKKALQSELQLSDTVERRMQETYEMLDAGESRKIYRPARGRRWTVVFAAAVLAVSTSVIALAANGFFTKEFTQAKEKAVYNFAVDYEMTPYDVEVMPGYLPEGFELKGEESPYSGKIHNDETGAGLLVCAFNAAELDELVLDYEDIESVEKTTLHDMEAHILKSKTNSDTLLLFNEAEGYVVQVAEIAGAGKEDQLSGEELKKVAENLEIRKLDTQIAYRSTEEEQREKEEAEEIREKRIEWFRKGVADENVFEVGEETIPAEMSRTETDAGASEGGMNIRYTVLDVEVSDSLPLSEFGPENYDDYENTIKPWVNEDGTLKARERNRWERDAAGADVEGSAAVETDVKSKYVVVKMKARNTLDTVDIFVSPFMKYLNEEPDGHYSYPTECFSTFNYDLQYGYPIGFDKNEGGEDKVQNHRFNFHSIGQKEEIEYTLVYVVDEDQLDHMYLEFYAEYGDDVPRSYVKLSK